jgi:hypothetical protein
LATLVVWSSYGVVRGQILSPDGQVGAPVQFPPALRVGQPSAIATVGDHFAVGVRTIPLAATQPTDVELVEVGTDGSVTSQIKVWETTTGLDGGFNSAPELPSVSWTGSDYRIAWFEPSSTTATLMVAGARGGVAVPARGTSVDPSLQPLTNPIWDGSEYGALALTGQQGARSLVFFRIGTSGNLLEAPIALASGTTVASLVWTGREFAAAWSSGSQAQFARLGTCP